MSQRSPYLTRKQLLLGSASLPSNDLPQWAHRVMLRRRPACMADLEGLRPAFSAMAQPEDIVATAAAWVETCRSATQASRMTPSGEPVLEGEAIRRLDAWTRLQPQAAWRCIQAILRAEPQQEELALLAAGPLKDLLVLHGRQFAAELEAETLQNPRFAGLLANVWRGGISQSLWERLQRALFQARRKHVATART